MHSIEVCTATTTETLEVTSECLWWSCWVHLSQIERYIFQLLIHLLMLQRGNDIAVKPMWVNRWYTEMSNHMAAAILETKRTSECFFICRK